MSSKLTLASMALMLGLKKMDEKNAIISVERKDNDLILKNKIGKEFSFELPQGERGDKGDSIRGDKGDQGAQGLPGKDGKTGARGLPSLSIKGDQGLSIKGDQGLKGDKGNKGDKGDKGDPADPLDVIKEVSAKFDQRGHWIVNMFGKKWDMGLLKGGGGGSSSNGNTTPFSSSTPMPTGVGGYPAGTTFDNVEHNSMWKGLLYGAIKPVFATFSINLSALIYEVGATISAGKYQAVWSITLPEYFKDNSIKIDYINGSTVTNLASNLANIVPTDITIPAITFNTPTAISFKITGESISEGEFYKSLDVNFYNRIYVGESDFATLDSDGIKALRINRLSATIDGDYQTIEGGYKWFCFPASMGQRYNFIDDATDLEVSMDDVRTVNVTNSLGVTENYYAYRSYFILHAALKIKVY
jgi:hypothetical protein